MSGIIHDLYHGRLYPAEQMYPRDGAYMELNQQIIDAQEEIMYCLKETSPEMKARFLAMLDTMNRANPIEAAEIFRQGFRLGARMMMDVMEEM